MNKKARGMPKLKLLYYEQGPISQAGEIAHHKFLLSKFLWLPAKLSYNMYASWLVVCFITLSTSIYSAKFSALAALCNWPRYSDDCEEVPIRGTCTCKSLKATRLPPSSFAGSERASLSEVRASFERVSSEFRGVLSAIILSPKSHAINALRGAFMRKI